MPAVAHATTRSGPPGIALCASRGTEDEWVCGADAMPSTGWRPRAHSVARSLKRCIAFRAVTSWKPIVIGTCSVVKANHVKWSLGADQRAGRPGSIGLAGLAERRSPELVTLASLRVVKASNTGAVTEAAERADKRARRAYKVLCTETSAIAPMSRKADPVTAARYALRGRSWAHVFAVRSEVAVVTVGAVRRRPPSSSTPTSA
jgi:hypothetical protein